MKNKFLIIIIVLLASSFTNNNKRICYSSSSKDYVLLIQYVTSNDQEVIKDYKRMNKKLKYICYLPAWNESYYDYFKKVLSLKEPPRLIDSSKIILWDAYKGNVEDITLPFDTSLITIDDLINDSIIQFTFKSMKYLLSPGQSFSDTIVNIEKEKKRVIKYTKSFEIRNYGLILKKNLIDLEEREKRSLRENMIRDSIDMNELNRSE